MANSLFGRDYHLLHSCIVRMEAVGGYNCNGSRAQGMMIRRRLVEDIHLFTLHATLISNLYTVISCAVPPPVLLAVARSR